MKPHLFQLFALGLAASGSLTAQMLGPQAVTVSSVAPVAENSSPGVAASATTHLTAEQLDQLLGPIALYPDALIALIFPSATVPSDIVLAARYLTDGDSAQIDNQPWDDSVKALAHYPDLVKWMDENLAWTKQVGETFLDQPAEVMKSVQRLRAAARAAGTLVDTPQQQVIAEAETISIVPAQPDVIYVPYYDPGIVYLPRRNYYSGSFLTFSVGYPVGFWLGYNMDWGHRRIWFVDRYARERYWRNQRDWRRPTFSGTLTWTSDPMCRPWNPSPVHVHSSHPVYFNRSSEIVRPSPIALQTQRLPTTSGDVRSRYDRTSAGYDRTSTNQNHETHWSRTNGRGATPTTTPSTTVQSQAPAPTATFAPAPAPTPAPAATISRGHRGTQTPTPTQTQPTPPSNSSSSRETQTHGRYSSSYARANAAASGSAPSSPTPAPAVAPAQSASSNAEAHTSPRASHQNHAASAAPAPAPAPAPQPQATETQPAASSTPSTSTSEHGRNRYYSRGGRPD